jgi:hypothetical protein
MFAYSTDNVVREAFLPSTPPADLANDLNSRSRATSPPKLLVTGHHP